MISQFGPKASAGIEGGSPSLITLVLKGQFVVGLALADRVMVERNRNNGCLARPLQKENYSFGCKVVQVHEELAVGELLIPNMVTGCMVSDNAEMCSLLQFAAMESWGFATNFRWKSLD